MDVEPCSWGQDERPAETDNGEQIVSPKPLRLNVNTDVTPYHATEV